jgi:hypothetical protein
MKNLAASAGALAFAIVSTPAVAAAVVPHVSVAIPHVKITTSKVNVPKGAIAHPRNPNSGKPSFEINEFSMGIENQRMGKGKPTWGT